MSVDLATTVSSVVGWMLIALAIIRAAWMAFARPAGMATLCQKCRYPVDPRRGSLCPECGTDAPHSLDLHLRRRSRWSWMVVACVLLCGIGCLTILPTLLRFGAWGMAPNVVLLRCGVGFGARGAQEEALRRLGERKLNDLERATLLGICTQLLRSKDQSDQEAALKIIWAISGCGDDRATETFLAALHDPAPGIRRFAVRAVELRGEPGPSWLVEELCKIVTSDADPTVRRTALLRLSPFFPDEQHLVRTAEFRRIEKFIESFGSTNQEFGFLVAAVSQFRTVRPTPLIVPKMAGPPPDLWLLRWAQSVGLENESLQSDLQRELDNTRVPVVRGS